MPLWMVILIVFRDIVITMLRSMQEYKGKTMKTSFIAKTKTFIQMTYIFFILILVCLLSFNISPEYSSLISNFLVSETNYLLMLIVTLITVATGVSYFFEKDKATIKTSS